MSTKTYSGSCHCGKVTFKADLDLSAGSGKCNCTYCTKVRNWSVLVKPEALHDVVGEEHLGAYAKEGRDISYGQHYFCKHCGINVFSRGNLPQIGGAYAGVMLAALDDAPIDELVSGPVRYGDGRNDNWMNPPADIRNL
jgi:hypothetical protein